MDIKEIIDRTKRTSELYFKGFEEEKPFDLWKSFDKDIAKELSLFITGQLYSREKIPHRTRQLIAISVLTALAKEDELKLHIIAGLNVGCTPQEIFEAILQTFPYAGIPSVNSALKMLRSVLKEKNLWPMNG